jgi:hypothetical protein
MIGICTTIWPALDRGRMASAGGGMVRAGGGVAIGGGGGSAHAAPVVNVKVAEVVAGTITRNAIRVFVRPVLRVFMIVLLSGRELSI